MKRKIMIYACICIILVNTSICYIYAEKEETVATDIESNTEIPEDAGTYFYRVYYEQTSGDTIEKIINVTVLLPHTSINSEVDEGIDASDFKIFKGIIENINNVDLIEKGKAKAWNLTTGYRVPIVEVNVKRINDSVLTVTYATEKGTQTTIYVIEVENEVLQLSKTFISYDYNCKFIDSKLSLILIVIAIASSIISLLALFLGYSKFRETREIVFNQIIKRD